jgi:class III poly(R)-hydroxyalkanoic acid synthase PhaE subunit
MAEKSGNENFFSKITELQDEMFDFWKKALIPFGNDNNNSSEKTTSSSQENYMDFLNQWWKMNAGVMDNFGLGAFNDTLQKMVSTNEVYMNLFRFWEDFSKQVEGNQKQVSDFVNSWRDQYSKLISSNIIPGLPEPIRSALKDPQEILQMYTTTMGKLFNPWTDNYAKLQMLLSKGIGGHKEAYMEFAKLWKELYGGTFAKLLRVPNLGMSRELSDKLAESTDKFIRYIQVLSEYTATIYKVGIDTMESILNKYTNMIKQDSQPKTFNEFYELWWKTNEEAYQALFSTDNFSKLLAQVVDATVTFKKNQNELFEEFLKEISIPVKSEMDGLYKTVYDLKKDVRKLKKEIEVLRKGPTEPGKEQVKPKGIETL